MSSDEARTSMTAYAHREESYEARLTEVGRGKPMGELMRRYRHPVAHEAMDRDVVADARDLHRRFEQERVRVPSRVSPFEWELRIGEVRRFGALRPPSWP